MKKLLAALSLLLATGCANYRLTENLSYDKTNVPFGVYDKYEPTFDAGNKRPVILAIHGGAWQGGDKSGMHRIADTFCPEGYVVLSINYRLSKDGPNWKGAPWPAQIEDCQTALKHFKDNAVELKINPDKIASLGISAGGHLATMLALRDNKIRTKFAVSLDGEHDMTLPPDQCMADCVNILTDLFHQPPPWTREQLKDISTIFFARPDVAVFIVHGASDNNVYVINAERLNDSLRDAGCEDVEYIRLEGKDGFCHGNCWENPKVLPKLKNWLEIYLKHDFLEAK